MIENQNEVSRNLEKALQALEQAKQRVANEKKKQNEKKRKAENHHKYIMGGIIVKYFPDCYQYDEDELKRFIRFQSLGEDFTEENLKKVIAGEKEPPERNEKMPERWKTRFYERYSDILKFNESCTEGEREILVLLELKKIPVLVLSSSSRRQLYPREEMAGESSLKLFFLDPEDYLFAKGYLVNIGYETDTLYPGVGEKMRIPGRFSVEIYHTFPFKTQVYQRGMEKLLQRAFLKENGNYIYEWNAIDQLVYLMIQSAYLYVTGHLQIRHLTDLYVFYRKAAEEDQFQELENRLKEFKVNILAQKLLHLSYMWFGTREECASMETEEEKLQVFDILEKNVFYGMTGKFGPETDEQALDLRSDILKEEERENRMEKRALFYRRLREFFSLVRRQLKELYDILYSR